MPTCPSFLRGRRMRVTRLDTCGRPVAGAGNQVVTSGFISVEMSPEVSEGEEIEVKNAGGELCITDKACDAIKWYNVTISLCQVDIDLVTIMNPTWRRIVDESGEVIGWAENNNQDCSVGFALELWTEVANAESVCDNPDAEGAWGYLLLPYLVGGTVGDLTIENAEVTFEYTSRTKIGSRWGVGPYNIRQNPVTSAPMPLPIVVASDEPRIFLITTLAPPDAVCGAQTVTPVPPPALEILSVTEDATDVSGNTAILDYTNWGAGGVTIDWDDGAAPTVAGPDTGTISHTYATAGTHTIVVTDADTPARTDSSTPFTTPFP